MTVQDDYVPVKSLGNGSNPSFSFAWKVFEGTDITVLLEDAITAVQTEQVLGVDYNVSLINDGSDGGIATFTVAPTSAEYVVIGRTVALTQPATYKTSSSLRGRKVEGSYDRNSMLIQQQSEEIGRCLKVQVGSTLTNLSLPLPEDGYGLVWNGVDGSLINTEESLAILEGNAAIVADNIDNINICAVNIDNINLCAINIGAIIAAPIAASNAAASEINAANSASNASVSEVNAANSASNAHVSEINAANSAAGVNLPPIQAGDVGRQLAVNVLEDGYVLIDNYVPEIQAGDAGKAVVVNNNADGYNLVSIQLPVGALYFNVVDATNPATSLGYGTWVAEQDRMIIGAGGTYAAGATGGSPTTTQTIAQIASHDHTVFSTLSGGGNTRNAALGDKTSVPDVLELSSSTGSSSPMTTISPYIAAYIWRRVA